MANSTQSPARILVVDDEGDILQAAQLLLKRHFASVQTSSDPASLPERVRQNSFDVLLLDMNFSPGADEGAEGLKWLGEVLAVDPQAVVVLVTAHSGVELAVQAMKQGASDFVTKPWENERLLATLLSAVNLRRSRIEAAELRKRNRGLAAATHIESGMIGTSSATLKVFDAIRRAAPTSANVLILGENGTGKELVAREIHRNSTRAGEVFLRVDVGSLSPQLFESELFGHRRGAFTDAKEDRIGLFRAAGGGTLFLDEIGNVPLHLQSKLLTALERHEVIPVGANRPEPIDVRLVCATNLAPGQLADPNRFREDLLYRINTVEILLPPLRERREDIPLLLEHFITLYAQKYNFPAKRLSAAALQALTAHDWPGNIRALRHSVERAVIFSEGVVFEPEDFSLATARPHLAADLPPDEASLDDVEKNAIARALAKHGGNVSRAAQALGVTRASLYRRKDKYGL
ncbi:MAG TPA: sigma-54 dependent transcriptional regulator [Steroidobacteraceae bacterium]|jgi:two-component system response regulator HydG|nr:sigma-54 dependent transcriptional regulator [Steroidobacteraceae bacterium]